MKARNNDHNEWQRILNQNLFLLTNFFNTLSFGISFSCNRSVWLVSFVWKINDFPALRIALYLLSKRKRVKRFEMTKKEEET